MKYFFTHPLKWLIFEWFYLISGRFPEQPFEIYILRKFFNFKLYKEY